MGGLLLGAAAGAVAGLLFAPKAGRETRELIKQSAEALPELAEDLSATVQIQAERLSDAALDRWDNTLLRLREAIEAGIAASRQVEVQPAIASPLSETPADAPTPPV
jgi:gas vesicle protein